MLILMDKKSIIPARPLKINENDRTVSIIVSICFGKSLISRIMWREVALVEQRSITGCVYP